MLRFGGILVVRSRRASKAARLSTVYSDAAIQSTAAALRSAGLLRFAMTDRRAALHHIGRIGVGNLPMFRVNPRRYKPSAMTFADLRSRKDIDDVIAYITDE